MKPHKSSRMAPVSMTLSDLKPRFQGHDIIVSNFSVIDPDINFSDHLPLRADIKCLVSSICSKDKNSTDSGKRMIQRQLRWDQADLASYYFATGDQLSPLLARVDDEMLRYSEHTASPTLQTVWSRATRV